MTLEKPRKLEEFLVCPEVIAFGADLCFTQDVYLF